MTTPADFPGAPGTLWTDADQGEWVYCHDGRMRQVQGDSASPQEVRQHSRLARPLLIPDSDPALLIDLAETLNRHSAGDGSHTPDHVQATFLIGCLASFDTAVRTRDALRAAAAPGVLR